jgi:AcrR family transcriptional regulator
MAARTIRGRQGEARRSDGIETRNLLMDAAEELFAELGVEGASIRSINAAAGLAPAAVHYHFGSKDRLIAAVIARRGADVQARSAELLGKVEAAAHPKAIDVVQALAEPFIELLERDHVTGRRWLQIVGEMVLVRDERVEQVGFGPGSPEVRFERVIVALYPALPKAYVLAQWRTATTALIQLLGHAPIVRRAELDDIVRFVAEGLDGVCRAKTKSRQ